MRSVCISTLLRSDPSELGKVLTISTSALFLDPNPHETHLRICSTPPSEGLILGARQLFVE